MDQNVVNNGMEPMSVGSHGILIAYLVDISKYNIVIAPFKALVLPLQVHQHVRGTTRDPSCLGEW